HVAPARRRLPRRTRRRAPARHRRGARGDPRPGGHQPAEGVQAVRLSRALPGMPAAAPVRIVHLGVGNFYRAHVAWYTHHAPDADAWGIAAFTGRRPDAADALGPQDGPHPPLPKGPRG